MLAQAIGDARSQEALQRVAARARSALQEGQIDADDYERLAPKYGARRLYLAGENASAASASS